MNSIRGIRKPLPPGTIVGRKIGSGKATPQIITQAELAKEMVTKGLVAGSAAAVKTGLAPIPSMDVLANIKPVTAVPVGVPISSILSTSGGGVLGVVTIITQTTDVYLM